MYYWGIRGTVVQFSGWSTCTYQPEALSDQYMHLQRSCGQTHVQIRDHEVDHQQLGQLPRSCDVYVAVSLLTIKISETLLIEPSLEQEDHSRPL